MRAFADQGVESLGGEPLGRECGLHELHVRQHSARSVSHGLCVTGVVGTVPTVERHAGCVQGDTVDFSGGKDHGAGADCEPLAVAEVERQGAVDAAIGHQQFHRHGSREYRALEFADLLSDMLLEFGAVEVDVIGAGQPEGAQPIIVVVAWILEIHAKALDPAQDPGHFVDHPAGHLHVDNAVGQFGYMLDEKFRRVPLGPGIHDGEVVVDAAADAAAVIEHLAFFADHHVQAGFQCRNGRHAAGDAAADHQHVRVQMRPPVAQRCLLTGQNQKGMLPYAPQREGQQLSVSIGQRGMR